MINLAKKRTNPKTNTRANTKSKNNETIKMTEQNTVRVTENVTELAHRVLTGEGKNPYYYSGITIQNFHELLDYLQQFSEHEANWLADWIDYLGDTQTALKIRETPSEFKTIINNRYNELKRIAEK